MLRLGVLPSSATAVCLLVLGLARPAQAGSVELVISKEADKLEQFAASELVRYVQRLFRLSATIVSSPSSSADAFFLLGTSDRLPGGDHTPAVGRAGDAGTGAGLRVVASARPHQRHGREHHETRSVHGLLPMGAYPAYHER